MKPSAVKYLADAILSQRYNKDIFDLHDVIQNAYLIEKESLEGISDEEIEKASLKVGYVHRDNVVAFQTGAKWYREELKKA